MYVVTFWKSFSYPIRKNKMISQHFLNLKEKTWELQIIHLFYYKLDAAFILLFLKERCP